MTDAQIAITRVFSAPRARVWQEWTEPERFADWFGGAESEVPLESVTMDVRPGGAWRLTMFAEPGRRRIDWHGEYLEVEPPERLVLTLTDQPEGGYALVTVVLSDLGDGRTEMAFEQTGPLPPELVEATRQGWGVFFDRIDEHLRA
ncbi:MAG TPA: SRPBCC domain-containing protein [Gaiellaceae bacterium]|nr:SRPBCC domain-containing protein [Gaiellaceae bacterium]